MANFQHSAKRYHDISAGHRVYGHESKCAHLHGHNYRIHFECIPGLYAGASMGLDSVGRVIDFSKIKELLCQWVEDAWDHRFLVWMDDPLHDQLIKLDPMVVSCPFNPTAENMAEYLITNIGPKQLAGTGVKLVKVTIEETAKCWASYGVG